MYAICKAFNFDAFVLLPGSMGWFSSFANLAAGPSALAISASGTNLRAIHMVSQCVSPLSTVDIRWSPLVCCFHLFPHVFTYPTCSFWQGLAGVWRRFLGDAIGFQHWLEMLTLEWKQCNILHLLFESCWISRLVMVPLEVMHVDVAKHLVLPCDSIWFHSFTGDAGKVLLKRKRKELKELKTWRRSRFVEIRWDSLILYLSLLFLLMLWSRGDWTLPQWPTKCANLCRETLWYCTNLYPDGSLWFDSEVPSVSTSSASAYTSKAGKLWCKFSYPAHSITWGQSTIRINKVHVWLMYGIGVDYRYIQKPNAFNDPMLIFLPKWSCSFLMQGSEVFEELVSTERLQFEGLLRCDVRVCNVKVQAWELHGTPLTDTPQTGRRVNYSRASSKAAKAQLWIQDRCVNRVSTMSTSLPHVATSSLRWMKCPRPGYPKHHKTQKHWFYFRSFEWFFSSQWNVPLSCFFPTCEDIPDEPMECCSHCGRSFWARRLPARSSELWRCGLPEATLPKCIRRNIMKRDETWSAMCKQM